MRRTFSFVPFVVAFIVLTGTPAKVKEITHREATPATRVEIEAGAKPSRANRVPAIRLLPVENQPRERPGRVPNPKAQGLQDIAEKDVGRRAEWRAASPSLP